MLNNQKGMAVMELIPIIVIMMIFINYSLGFFGVIHTGILNSMAARNYTFETFSHRSNLVYFRDAATANAAGIFYSKVNFRAHATVSERAAANNQTYLATERPIDFMDKEDATGANTTIHNQVVYTIQDASRFTATQGANPVWVRPQYGICLNSICGQSN